MQKSKKITKERRGQQLVLEKFYLHHHSTCIPHRPEWLAPASNRPQPTHHCVSFPSPSVSASSGQRVSMRQTTNFNCVDIRPAGGWLPSTWPNQLRHDPHRQVVTLSRPTPKGCCDPPPSPPAVTFNSPENKKLCHYCNFHFLNFPRFLFFVVCCSSRSLYAARYWPGMSTQHGQSAGHCQRFSSSSATETFLWHRQRRLRRWPSNCRKARVNSRRFSRDWMQKPEPNDQQRIGKGGKKENEKREKEREKGFSTSCGYALSST